MSNPLAAMKPKAAAAETTTESSGVDISKPLGVKTSPQASKADEETKEEKSDDE